MGTDDEFFGTGFLAWQRFPCAAAQGDVNTISLPYHIYPCAMDYQKVGRGGAGNFYTPKDVQKACKETSKVREILIFSKSPTALTNCQDVEAQRNAASGAVEDLESQGRRFSTSGRGGAGNVTTRDVLAAGTTANVDVTPSLEETKPPELGHYGRGGAGNYRIPEHENKRGGEKDILEAQEKAHQEVVKDVEMGLKEPEKAHLGREGLE